MGCKNCKKEIEVEEKTRIVKLPEILIFTLERYQGTPNKVKIEPDDILEMSEYIDKSSPVESTSYELFAINIRFGSTINYGHEICQVKRDGIWYEINDSSVKDIKNSYFDSSYGLFYRRIKKLKNGNLKTSINRIQAKSNETKIKDSQQKLKDSQVKIDDKHENIKESQDNKIDSQDNAKDFQKKLKDSLQNTKDSKQNLKDSKEIINREIVNKNINTTDNSKSTPNKEAVNNIDNNKNYGIETIDILKEVIINNIKKEEIFTQFISYINDKYQNLIASKCSQEIIIKILKELNNFKYKYKNYYYYNDKAYAIFAVSLYYHYSYQCDKCYKIFKYYYGYNKTFNDYKAYKSPEFLIDLPMQNSASLDDIVKKYFSLNFYSKDKCSLGHTIEKYLTVKIDKLPKILIFTLKKKDKNNNIKIIPDDILIFEKDYYNKLKYQLFAVNILKDEKLGYECQININNIWYEIRNNNKLQINGPTPSKYIIGLFYKKI